MTVVHNLTAAQLRDLEASARDLRFIADRMTMEQATRDAVNRNVQRIERVILEVQRGM
jgi:hypothetical protein